MTTQADLTYLLSRIALRDRAAFEQLYGATSAHLLGVAFRILRSRERAEDALQEAYTNVWQGAGSFNAAVASPMTWLINVVRNKAIDAARSGQSMRSVTVPLDDEALAVAADDAHQPQRLFDEHLSRLKIDACMNQLAAAQRQALALAYYRGMVHTEIAQALGAPLGTAKAWVRRGLDKLKGCLEAAGVQGA